MPLNPTSLTLTTILVLMPPTLLADLVVSGVDSELERNVRAYVSLADEPCDAETWRVRRRYRSIETETRKALEPFGFYEPRISSTLRLDEECWKATLTIGAASTDPAFDELKPPASLAVGRTLRHADYDQYKRALQIRAADRGYVEAEFTDGRQTDWPT
jgi:translocation and assembly module TamA